MSTTKEFSEVSLAYLAAVHEAAHAVLCVRFKIPFNYVTIEPKDETDGHVAIHMPRYHNSVWREGRIVINPRIENYFAMLMAGVEATAIYLDLPPAIDLERGGSGDLKTVKRIIREFYPSQAKELIERAKQNARRLVQQPRIREQIEMVAADLRISRTLDSSTVKMYCKR